MLPPRGDLATAVTDGSGRLRRKGRHRRDSGHGRLGSGRAQSLVIALCVVLVAGVALPAAAISASRATSTTQKIDLQATETAWTTSRQANTSQSKTSYLSATRSQDRSYLKFDTSDLNGKNILSAELELRVASTKATTGGFQVYRSSSEWSAGSLTHANRPAHVPGEVNQRVVPAVAGTVVIPLAAKSLMMTSTVMALEVRYSQPYVTTTLHSKGRWTPTLRVTVSDGSTVLPSPVAPSTPAVTASTTPTESQAPSPVPSPTQTGTPTVPVPSVPPTDSSDLAFPVAGSNTTSKKVFAHYFPPYPISLDNKTPASDYYANNYMSRTGEGGKFAQSGGLLRDRPEGREPLSGNWRVTDMTSDVVNASEAGIDGFTVNIMSVSGLNWERTVNLYRGAEQARRNFSVIPNLDLTAGVADVPIETIAAKMAELYRSPSAHRLSTGQYVLSSFAAERRSVQWWKDLKSTLQARHGITVALIPVFVSATDANLAAYAPISYALGNWGVRTPPSVSNAPDYTAKAHALGVKWMAPVAIQDVRPRSFLYDEAGNTETLRAMWDRAISDGSDLVQLVTWNDYSESTSFAPSLAHGNSFLDINAYYQSLFKTGESPAIVGDAAYLTHRVQATTSRPSITHRLMLPTLSGTAMKPRDTVEVLTFLTSAATVSVTVGGRTETFEAPAGVSAGLVPLRVGEVSVTVTRDGVPVAAVTSPYVVSPTPAVQDMQYYGVSTRRD